jgi:hypothetical protein
VQDAEQVDVDLQRDVLLGLLPRPSGPQHARVVHPHRDPPEFGGRRGHAGVVGGGARVGGHPRGPELAGRAADDIGVQVRDQHPVAAGDEAAGDLAAEAARGTGDDGDGVSGVGSAHGATLPPGGRHRRGDFTHPVVTSHTAGGV